MASDRVLRALDMLAGVAGQEIDRARQFQVEQNLRMETLARLAQREQREAEHQEAQLNLQRTAQRQSAEQFKQREQRLAAQDEALRGIQKSQQQTQLNVAAIRARSQLRTAQMNQLVAAEEALSQAQLNGLSDDELLPFLQKVRASEVQVYGKPLTPLPRTTTDEVPPEGAPPPPEGEQGDSALERFVKFLGFGLNENQRTLRESSLNELTTEDIPRVGAGSGNRPPVGRSF